MTRLSYVSQQVMFCTARGHSLGPKTIENFTQTYTANCSIFYNINLTSVQRCFDNSRFNILWTFLFLDIQGNHSEKGFCQKVDDLDTTDD